MSGAGRAGAGARWAWAPSVALWLAGCRVTALAPGDGGGGEAAAVTPAPPFDPTGDVDPFIGTAAHGHTFPGATWPFGMVQLGPDTRLTGWDGCSGYHYDDAVVHGFSHTHLSGTGIADYADVMIVPTVIGGPARTPPDPEHPFAMRFDHADEDAGPGWYRLRLREPEIEVELTATPRVGLHRHRFSGLAGGEPGLVLDLRHRDEVLEAWVEQVSPTEWVGLRRSRSWARDQRVYFAARLSRPVASVTSLGEATEREAAGHRRWEGTDVRLQLALSPGDEPLVVAVALSPVDVDGARANLRAEAPHDDFDAYLGQARERWREALAAVEIEGGTRAQRRTFYTALYHSMLAPNLYEDVDGRTRGMDGEIHRTPGHTAYTVFSLWDTFRAAHPLLTILEPERSADFVRTLLHQARTGGRLPMWELAA
ncbi:MAG: GH92 family glycosyl hydrolase, partial [Myxococcales bacterium]|nr:GH92 family glycosyl hydrolase [Myxococcales bacterium]